MTTDNITKGSVLARESQSDEEESKITVVIDIGDLGLRLAEKFVKDGKEVWTAYWSPESELEASDFKVLHERNMQALAGARQKINRKNL